MDYNGSHHLLNSKYFSISEFYTCSSAVHLLEVLLEMAPVLQSTQEEMALYSVESTGSEYRPHQGQAPASPSSLPLTNSLSSRSQLTAIGLSLLICKMEIIIVPISHGIFSG